MIYEWSTEPQYKSTYGWKPVEVKDFIREQEHEGTSSLVSDDRCRLEFFSHEEVLDFCRELTNISSNYFKPDYTTNNIFNIDLKDMPVEKARAYVEKIKNEIHQRRLPNNLEIPT